MTSGIAVVVFEIFDQCLKFLEEYLVFTTSSLKRGTKTWQGIH